MNTCMRNNKYHNKCVTLSERENGYVVRLYCRVKSLAIIRI